MKYRLKVYSIQEFGQRKDSLGNPHQEDSLFPAFGKQTDSDRLFILCDGMGGHDAGEVASATVCEAMSSSILADGHDAEGKFTEADFDNALKAAFEALDTKDSGAEKKMGTTLAFLKLYDEGAFIAHIGDSRVYHIRPGQTGEDTRILHETSDHSLVNDLIKIGELTREEARHSKQKNVITRAMQPYMERRPKADVYRTSDIKGGDYFYLCSDGMLEQDEMEDGSSLRNIFSEQGGTDENKVEILRSVTEDNRDNHTAFIVHILEVTDPIAVKREEKFTAIVEDDNRAKPVASPKRSMRPMVVRFLIAAFVVALLLVGINFLINSCSSDDKKVPADFPESVHPDYKEEKPTSAKPTITPTPTAAPEPAQPEAIGAGPVRPTSSSATSTSTSTQTESAPSKSAKKPTAEEPKPTLPNPASEEGGTVNSDQQNIQDLINGKQ